MKSRITAILATGALCLGLSLVAAAPAQAAPIVVNWKCNTGEIAAPLMSYGNIWKGCYNTVTKKWRIVGVVG